MSEGNDRVQVRTGDDTANDKDKEEASISNRDEGTISTDATPVPCRPGRDGGPASAQPASIAARIELLKQCTNSISAPGANFISVVGSSNVAVGDTYHFKIVQKESSTDERAKSERAMTESIRKVAAAQTELSHTYMSIIMEQIGHNWKQLFRELGLPDGEIETVYESHIHEKLPEVIYQLLLKVIRASASKVTLGRVCTLLWKLEKYDLVDSLACAYEGDS